MATRNGATTLDLGADIGSIEPGKKADITMFRMLAADWAPVINPVANLVFSSRGGAHTVMVDGRILLDAGEPKSIDEDRTLVEAQRRAEAIVARSGLDQYCTPQWAVQ
jgi:5-methylthioadenosine/S-adenosylhomocysteine deaminase